MSLNICKRLTDFKIDLISFNNTIKNKIIKGENSVFTGINITINNVILNNICLVFSVKNPLIINYNINDNTLSKYKCIFDSRINNEIISSLERIENSILDKYIILNRIRYLKKVNTLNMCDDQLYHIKFYSNLENKGSINKRYTLNSRSIKDPHKKLFVLKISGVWENNGKIGVSYKISSL